MRAFHTAESSEHVLRLHKNTGPRPSCLPAEQLVHLSYFCRPWSRLTSRRASRSSAQCCGARSATAGCRRDCAPRALTQRCASADALVAPPFVRAAAQELDAGGDGVQGAAHILREEDKGPQQGAPARRLPAPAVARGPCSSGAAGRRSSSWTQASSGRSRTPGG